MVDCNRCGNSFENTNKLIRHLNKKYPCKTILSNIDRNDYINNINNKKTVVVDGIKYFICYYCKKNLKSAPSKSVHQKKCKAKFLEKNTLFTDEHINNSLVVNIKDEINNDYSLNSDDESNNDLVCIINDNDISTVVNNKYITGPNNYKFYKSKYLDFDLLFDPFHEVGIIPFINNNIINKNDILNILLAITNSTIISKLN